MDWRYFPVFLKLDGRRVLLVGGGEIAARKLRLLRRTRAAIDVVAADLNDEFQAAVDESRVQWLGAQFDAPQLSGYRLVIAATDDAELNRTVASAADAVGIPVNVVDDEAASSYITPAIVDRSPLLVAISSGGAAPVLARRLREKLETELPSQLGKVAAFMQRWRAEVAQRMASGARRGLWERWLDGPGMEGVINGDEALGDASMRALLDGEPVRGEVYLVGAGPGDPDLLTFKALRLMQQCDVVLHDRLISPQVLELVRRDARRLFVGKARSHHAVPQDEINAELVRLAQSGLRVLRLKGGDPFIFGRGGEEIDTLMQHGVPFQVVPGITAASGCSAYAGIPLTHRDHAQACIFVTGHARKDGTLDLHWDQLARRGQTVVVYMGLNTLPELCAQLMAHGLPPEWPAAMVSDGTSPQQRVITGSLQSLPDAVTIAELSGPSLLIVGEVVTLRDRLAWLEQAPAAVPSISG